MAFLQDLAKALGTGFQEQYNVQQYGPQYAQEWEAAPQAEIARMLQIAEAGQRLQGVIGQRQTEEGLAARAFPGVEPALALKLYRMSEAERKRGQEIEQEASEAELRRASATAAVARAKDFPAEEARRSAEHRATLDLRREEALARRSEAGSAAGLRNVQREREEAELAHFRKTGFLPGREPTGGPGGDRIYAPIDTDKLLQQASDIASSEVQVDPKTGKTPPPTRDAITRIYKELLTEEENRRLSVQGRQHGPGPETRSGTGAQPGSGPPCPAGVNEGAQIRSKSTGRVAVCRGGRLVVQQQ